MPVFAAFFLICMLSSVGLPGLNGFVGEILCLFGIFKANMVLAILGVTTVILAAAYLLWMFQRVMHGPITNDRVHNFKDINKREIAYLLPIVILMFWMGLYPQPFLRKMDASVNKLINQINQKKMLFTETKKEPRLLWDIKTIENTAEDHQEKEEPVQ
jgi:NADH-quinone oxidoreductase subunit M